MSSKSVRIAANMDPTIAQLGAIGDLWKSVPHTLRKLGNKISRLYDSPALFKDAVELVNDA